MKKAGTSSKTGRRKGVQTFHSQISFAANLTFLNKTCFSPGVKSMHKLIWTISVLTH